MSESSWGHFGDLIGADPHRNSLDSQTGAESEEEGCFRSDRQSGLLSEDVGKQFLPPKVADALTPFERLLVTANGNLQRIVSSWTNLPVRVNVVKNEKLGGSSEQILVFDRKVELLCAEVKFGVAESVVTLSEFELIQAVFSHQIGIGQLFRHFNILPAFNLLSVSPSDTKGDIRRSYTLSAPGVVCEISELLNAGQLLHCMQVRDEKTNKPVSNPSSLNDHYGDLMEGTQTAVSVHNEDFQPFHRVLVTANGNVQRLLSSYLNAPVRVRVKNAGTLQESSDKSVGGATYVRHVHLCNPNDEVLCDARSTIHLNEDDKLLEAVRHNKVSLGSIFGHPGLRDSRLPHFELEEARFEENCLLRKYVLHTDTIKVEIEERFYKVRVHCSITT